MVKRIAVVCLMVATIAAAPAASAQGGPMRIPDNLRVPDGNVLVFTMPATGVQIYTCAAQADDPDKFAWSFKAPEAELQNELGQTVGSHYAGPTWEANDGSTVVGEVMARSDSPDPHAIPWLLLKARFNEGRGVFSTVTYVQRLQTSGGAAPAEGCDRSAAGSERRVPYTATYAFYFGG